MPSMSLIGAALAFAGAGVGLFRGIALAGFRRFAAGFDAGFFFAVGIGIDMPGMFIPCIE